MKRTHLITALAAALGLTLSARASAVDVLVVGGSTSGVAAAVQAARMGASVVIAEELPWIGGMLTSAGVSATDGNYRLRSGFWGEFVDSLTVHYGSPEALRSGWVSNIMFEPEVGERILSDIVAGEKNITLLRNTALSSLHPTQGGWRARLTDASGSVDVEARRVIDATELADVAALVGIPFDKGMESASSTGEDIAPDHSNDIIQDLTYVAILAAAATPAPMERPEGYDPSEFACCAINPLCTNPKEPARMWSPAQMLSYGRLPGGKYMINWPIEGNDFYADLVDAPAAARAEAIAEAKARTMRFIYFMRNELGMDSLDIARDVFPTSDGLPLIPYYREGRRIHGIVRVTLGDLADPYGRHLPLYRTSIAVGDYPVDQHHSRYDGDTPLPDLHYHPIPSWGLPAGALIPADAENFIVAEKGISVSNIVNGTTRLQPVVLQIGQAAGALAALSAREGVAPADVPVRRLQQALLDAGCYLLPYVDIAPGDDAFVPMQRIGACGILRGEGRSEGWSNITRIYPDSIMTLADMAPLFEYYSAGMPDAGHEVLTCRTLSEALASLGVSWKSDAAHADMPLTRKQYACIVDSTLNPFALPVDYHGNRITNTL